MHIKKLLNIGGMSSLQRYISMLAGNPTFVSTTTTAVALALNGSPYVAAYAWSNGIGSKYSNPSSLPSFYTYDVKWSPNKNDVILADYSAGLTAYAWSSGFGSKYSSSSIFSGQGRSVVFSASGDTVFAGSNSTPYIYAYPWTSGTGFGTKYANPGTIPNGGLYGIQSIDFGSNTVFAITYSSPYFAAYAWSAGFGSKYADPATLPSSSYGINYNGTANAIAVAQYSGSPYVYPWSAGFGTKYADPASTTSASTAVKFNNDGTAIVSALTIGQGVDAWAWSSGYGSKYANPPQLIVPNGAVGFYNSLVFSNDGKLLGVSGGSSSASPYFGIYYFTSANGFIFKFPDPTSAPGAAPGGISFR